MSPDSWKQKAYDDEILDQRDNYLRSILSDKGWERGQTTLNATKIKKGNALLKIRSKGGRKGEKEACFLVLGSNETKGGRNVTIYNLRALQSGRGDSRKGVEIYFGGQKHTTTDLTEMKKQNKLSRTPWGGGGRERGRKIVDKLSG